MICEANKLKRLEWTQEYVHEAEVRCSNVIFTDEPSIQLEPHRQFCSKAKTQANMSIEYIYVYRLPCSSKSPPFSNVRVPSLSPGPASPVSPTSFSTLSTTPSRVASH